MKIKIIKDYKMHFHLYKVGEIIEVINVCISENRIRWARKDNVSCYFKKEDENIYWKLIKEFKVGDSVIHSSNLNESHSKFYPPIGTIGKILEMCPNSCLVKWPFGTTTGQGVHYVSLDNIELVEEKPTTLSVLIVDMKPSFDLYPIEKPIFPKVVLLKPFKCPFLSSLKPGDTFEVKNFQADCESAHYWRDCGFDNVLNFDSYGIIWKYVSDKCVCIKDYGYFKVGDEYSFTLKGKRYIVEDQHSLFNVNQSKFFEIFKIINEPRKCDKCQHKETLAKDKPCVKCDGQSKFEEKIKYIYGRVNDCNKTLIRAVLPNHFPSLDQNQQYYIQIGGIKFIIDEIVPNATLFEQHKVLSGETALYVVSGIVTKITTKQYVKF